MEKKNQYMEVAYQLFVDGENGQEMTEEATKERPFQFITGFGVALDAFEQQVAGLQKGDSFDFTITHDQAYGDYRDDLVLDLEREVFGDGDHWEAVKEVLDALYPGLWETLGLKYPDMDEMERRVYMLSQLKLSRLGEATLLGISTSVLDKIRGKVRKMMEQP